MVCIFPLLATAWSESYPRGEDTPRVQVEANISCILEASRPPAGCHKEHTTPSLRSCYKPYAFKSPQLPSHLLSYYNAVAVRPHTYGCPLPAYFQDHREGSLRLVSSSI